NYRGAPGQTSAEHDQQQQISGLNPAGTHGLIQGNGNGSSGGIAVLVQVDKHLFGLRAQALSHSLDDSQVSLVRNDQLNAGDVDFAAAERLVGGGLHSLDGAFEGFLAFHAQVVQARLNRFGGGRTSAAATSHKKQVRFRTIRTHNGGKEAVGVGAVAQH